MWLGWIWYTCCQPSAHKWKCNKIIRACLDYLRRGPACSHTWHRPLKREDVYQHRLLVLRTPKLWRKWCLQRNWNMSDPEVYWVRGLVSCEISFICKSVLVHLHLSPILHIIFITEGSNGEENRRFKEVLWRIWANVARVLTAHCEAILCSILYSHVVYLNVELCACAR